jgi:hypothetical protein
MVNIDYLVLAVSNLYKDSKDYEKIDSIKYFSIVKGAIWGRIDRKKNKFRLNS